MGKKGAKTSCASSALTQTFGPNISLIQYNTLKILPPLFIYFYLWSALGEHGYDLIYGLETFFPFFKISWGWRFSYIACALLQESHICQWPNLGMRNRLRRIPYHAPIGNCFSWNGDDDTCRVATNSGSLLTKLNIFFTFPFSCNPSPTLLFLQFSFLFHIYMFGKSKSPKYAAFAHFFYEFPFLIKEYARN